MASVNSVALLGRVGQTPETKDIPTGNTVTTLSLATHEVWKDHNGEKKENVEWHRITVSGEQAENVARYVNKGDLIYVEGKISTDTYEKNGVKHWVIS